MVFRRRNGRSPSARISRDMRIEPGLGIARRSPGRYGLVYRADRRSKSSRAAPAIIAIILSATSSWTQRSRSAEQRCPAERNAEASTSSQTCSGRAVASAIIVLIPPVSAINTGIGPSFAAKPRWIFVAVSIEPVKATPAIPGKETSLSPSPPSPGKRCKAEPGTPARWKSAIAAAAIKGVCSAGLARTLFPATKRRGDLPEKDRQRKVPRADAEKHAAPMTMETIVFSRRSSQRQWSVPIAAALPARNSGRNRWPPATRRWRHRWSCRLRSGAARASSAPPLRAIARHDRDRPRARLAGYMRPQAEARARIAHGLGQQSRRGFLHAPNRHPVDRRNNVPRLSFTPNSRDNWRRVAGLARRQLSRKRERQARGDRRIQRPPRVCATAYEVSVGNGRPGARRVFLVADDGLRPDDKLRCGHMGIAKARDKGRIGAVFEKAAHEIGEQIFVNADRRIDTAGDPRQLGPQGGEKVFAHAVETLEFKAARPARKFGDCRDRQRIMGRELRIDDVRAWPEAFSRKQCS